MIKKKVTKNRRWNKKEVYKFLWKSLGFERVWTKDIVEIEKV